MSNTKRTILVTGGSGFIGANFILRTAELSEFNIVNLDKLTYAGNQENLVSLTDNPSYRFVHGDICDSSLVNQLFRELEPIAVVHFAAETHVDRSIANPTDSLQTNIYGTFTLLEASRSYYASSSSEQKASFRFLHVSTDEVYGTLGPNDPPFSERTAYAPNSPYSASKASSDHLVRAWHHTYGLPTLITNCSNNYGPYQFPEKLIPLLIHNALSGKPIPVYGDGRQIRDWLFVEDHCDALLTVLAKGRPGETYNIGGGNQRSNIEVVRIVCALLDELRPNSPFAPHSQLITHVQDRPGHDRRYAIDAEKIVTELGWHPKESFETGLQKTINWYLANPTWIRNATTGAYQNWIGENYGSRKHVDVEGVPL